MDDSIEQQKLHDHPFDDALYELTHIRLDSFDRGNDRLLFIKISAQIENMNDQTLPRVIFMRGGSVTILMNLRPFDAPEELSCHLFWREPCPSYSLTCVQSLKCWLSRSLNDLGDLAIALLP